MDTLCSEHYNGEEGFVPAVLGQIRLGERVVTE